MQEKDSRERKKKKKRIFKIQIYFTNKILILHLPIKTLPQKQNSSKSLSCAGKKQTHSDCGQWFTVHTTYQWIF